MSANGDFDVRRHGTVLVFALAGEVDLARVASLREPLGRTPFEGVSGFVVDMSATSFVDSAGIRLLYELRARVQSIGRGLRLVAPPNSPVLRTLELAGAREAFATSPSLDDALAALTK